MYLLDPYPANAFHDQSVACKGDLKGKLSTENTSYHSKTIEEYPKID